MTFIPSLVLYNPLEMLIIIIGCDLITKNKTNLCKLLFISYFGGAVNLFFQYIPNMLIGTPIHFVINNFVTFILVPFLMYLVGKSYSDKYTFFDVYIVYAINFSISMCIALFINEFIVTAYYGYFENGFYELVTNLSVRFVEMILVIIIHFLEEHYEKFTKENC